MASNENTESESDIDPRHLFSLLSRTLGREVPLRRFYCHRCTHNFMYRGRRNPAEDTEVITCPSCHSPFVEELETPPVDDSFMEYFMEDVPEDESGASGERATETTDSSDDPPEEVLGDAPRRANPTSSGADGGLADLPRRRLRFPRATIVIHRQVPARPPSLAGMLHEHIARMVEARDRGEEPPPYVPPEPPQLYIGLPWGMPGPPPRNPGDYAWGPQGLDNIISQMLANLEDPGPPPADKDKVKALPTVVATEENLKECSDCSVCKEVFSVGETVRKLPCDHLYHNDCLLPWLELHDTCPTCRFSINTGKPANA